MNARPEMSQQLEVLLNQYRTSGVHQLTETLLKELGQAPGIQEQLDAIGSLDHHTENIIRFDGAGTLCKRSGSYYPVCFVTCAKLSNNKLAPHFFRIRLLHFLLKDDTKQLLSLLNENCSVPESPDVEPSMFQVVQAAELALREATRRRKMTVEDLQVLLGVEVPPVTNMASQMTMYHSFKTSMLEQGFLYWVHHHTDGDVFVLNDYSSVSSQFQVTDFILAEVVNSQVIYCGCDTYKTLQGSVVDGSCMHCRFLEDEVIPCMRRVQQPGFSPDSGISMKVSNAWQEKNAGCVRVGPATGKVHKFCVLGRDSTVAFVHMSVDEQYVCCMSGECKVRMGAKKKLQGLMSAALLCPHLDMFRAKEEMWQQYREEGAVDVEENEDATPAASDDVNIEDANQVKLLFIIYIAAGGARHVY